MATTNAVSMNDTQYSGDMGAAHAHGAHTLSAAQPGDKVRMFSLFAGTKIFDWRVVNAALGAGTTISLGWEMSDGTAGGSATALLPATSTAAAACTRAAAVPILLTADAIITVTVGGAVATGQFDAILVIEHRGTL